VDIKAWAVMEHAQAAIEEINDKVNFSLQTAYSMGHQTQQPEVKIKLYDSGASRHMSPFTKQFMNYHTILPQPITATNKQTFYAIGIGNLQIDVPNGESTTPVILHDTLHTPKMVLTIVSIR